MPCCLAIENKTLLFAATWMDLEIIILREVSQKGKDKYHMISLTRLKKKKNDANEPIYQTGTASQT